MPGVHACARRLRAIGAAAPLQRVATDARPRVCIVGPMVGRNPGHVIHQGEVLADGLAAEGYDVLSVSSCANRYARLADIVETLVRCGRRIDVLVVQVYGGASFVVEDISSAIGRRFGHRIIMVLHGGAMPEFMRRFPRWSKRVLRRADALVTPSPFLARVLEQFDFAASVIPNAIGLDTYPYRRRSTVAPRLLWMRSFHDTYNPQLAIRTLARVYRTHPEATLVMAGQDNGLGRTVQALAERLGVGHAVRFPGFLDMAGKQREGCRADIFLNTNRIDNMPVAVLEAAAMGLPVVATRVGGLPDLLTHGETGLLVPDDDDAAMAAAVLRLLGEPALAGRLSTAGRRLAMQSSWTAVLPRWQAVLSGMPEVGRAEAGI